jgi:hypothetical protein
MGNHSGGTNRGAFAARAKARTTAGGGSGTRTAAAKPATKLAAEGVHEHSARLQREGGLAKEVRPGHEKAIGNMPESYRTDPFNMPKPSTIKTVYGEHQYGAVLHNYTHETLREEARAQGIEHTGRSKAETISIMTARATEGRYSANFGSTAKATGGAKRASTATAGAPMSGGRARSAQGERIGATKAPLAELVPIGNMPAGYRTDPFSSPIPDHLVRVFGRPQLARALHEYTVAALKETADQYQARHPGTKPTNRGRRDALTAYIIGQYDQEQAK